MKVFIDSFLNRMRRMNSTPIQPICNKEEALKRYRTVFWSVWNKESIYQLLSIHSSHRDTSSCICKPFYLQILSHSHSTHSYIISSSIHIHSIQSFYSIILISLLSQICCSEWYYSHQIIIILIFYLNRFYIITSIQSISIHNFKHSSSDKQSLIHVWYYFWNEYATL